MQHVVLDCVRVVVEYGRSRDLLIDLYYVALVLLVCIVLVQAAIQVKSDGLLVIKNIPFSTLLLLVTIG